AASIKITNITDQSATISWADAKGADSYRVYLSDDLDFLVLEDSFPKNVVGTSFSPKGLLSGATLHVKVKSLNKNNSISESAVSSFTTLNGDEYLYTNLDIVGLIRVRANAFKGINPGNYFEVSPYFDNYSNVKNITPIGDSRILFSFGQIVENGTEVPGRLTAVDRFKMAPLWTFVLEVSAIPFFVDDAIFVGSGQNEVALNATTGRVLYSFATNGVIKSTPFATADKLY
ncbi:MAG: hypothetical protein ACKO96_40690, partial [Flammeovirgaceae bacterium]